MGCLGNIIWMLCGGLVSALGYLIAGCIWCITIVGIPVGMQCFKLVGLALFPFGKDVTYGGGLGSFLLNIIWAIFFGIPIALHSLLWSEENIYHLNGRVPLGKAIPFGLQHFKMAKLALMPFGTVVY